MCGSGANAAVGLATTKCHALLYSFACSACAAAPGILAWHVALQYTAAGCAYPAAPNEIKWYGALIHAAVGWAWAAALASYVALLIEAVCWACAAASRGTAWYVALLFTVGGWVCVAAPNEIAWCITLLYAQLCGTRRAVPCWPAESLALLNITTAQAAIMPVAMAAALLLR